MTRNIIRILGRMIMGRGRGIRGLAAERVDGQGAWVERDLLGHGKAGETLCFRNRGEGVCEWHCRLYHTSIQTFVSHLCIQPLPLTPSAQFSFNEHTYTHLHAVNGNRMHRVAL